MNFKSFSTLLLASFVISQWSEGQELHRRACERVDNHDAEIAATTSLANNLEAQYNWRLKRVETLPSKLTTTEITYTYSQELQLAPNEAVYFMIPASLQDRPVSFIILGHRQSENHIGWNRQTERDDLPGLTSVQVHPVNADEKEWRYWAGSSSGRFGGKYAEPRSTPEMDNLYDWLSIGHRSIQTNARSTEPLKINSIRIINTGTDQVLVKNLNIKFTPNPAPSYMEKIFTPGTSFHEMPGRKGRFGGGQSYRGLFPQALALNSYGQQGIPSLNNMRLVRPGLLEVDAPEGKNITSVEIAGGDSRPDQVINKDGGWGSPGGARFSIGIGKSASEIRWFVQNENVPPEGLLFGAPADCDKKIGPNEKLYISATSDVFYIMGFRIGLE